MLVLGSKLCEGSLFLQVTKSCSECLHNFGSFLFLFFNKLVASKMIGQLCGLKLLRSFHEKKQKKQQSKTNDSEAETINIEMTTNDN